MATQTPLAPSDYLASTFDGPDREYLDGQLKERSLPTYLHARLQILIGALLYALSRRHAVYPASELRIQIEPGQRYRIPDLCLLSVEPPADSIAIHPPLLAIEISSPDDRLADTLTKFAEYQAIGISHIWLIDGENRRLYQYDAAGLHPATSLSLPQFDFHLTLATLELES